MKLSRAFLGKKQLQLPRPRQLKIVNIPLKKHDICLEVQQSISRNISYVLPLTHISYKSPMLIQIL